MVDRVGEECKSEEAERLATWRENLVRSHIKPDFVSRVLDNLKDPDFVIDPTWRLERPSRFQFDPAKNSVDKTLEKQIRELANRPSGSTNYFSSLDFSETTIFSILWPNVDLIQVCTTPTARIALGVVAFCAYMTPLSAPFRHLLAQAPERPNYEFHMVNALFATLKLTTKASPEEQEASTMLLQKTLQFLESSLTSRLPDMAIPRESDAPFPILARLTHSLIDLLACTPRLTAYLSCGPHDTAEEGHIVGYRVQGHFLDALRVAPDESCTLAEVLAEFEQEFLEPAAEAYHCSEGHPLELREYSWGLHPPPLLVFEATTKAGIPRRCLCEEVVLGDRVYLFAAALSVDLASDGEQEDDLVLETEVVSIDTTERTHVALVFYVVGAAHKDAQGAEEEDNDDEENDSSHNDSLDGSSESI